MTPQDQVDERIPKITDIQFGFDERRFPQDISVPLNSKQGIVTVKYSDGTAAGLYCTRDTLGEKIAQIVNDKTEAAINKLAMEARIDELEKLLTAWNETPKYQLHYGKRALFDITQYNQDRLKALKQSISKERP